MLLRFLSGIEKSGFTVFPLFFAFFNVKRRIAAVLRFFRAQLGDLGRFGEGGRSVVVSRDV